MTKTNERKSPTFEEIFAREFKARWKDIRENGRTVFFRDRVMRNLVRAQAKISARYELNALGRLERRAA
jgi:hypothetical protein